MEGGDGVFNQANAMALDAFDELEGLGEPTKPAEPFLAAFTSESDRQKLIDEFDHVAELGKQTAYTLLDGDEIHALEPSLGDAVTCGVRLTGSAVHQPRTLRARRSPMPYESAAARSSRGDVRDIRDTDIGVELEVKDGAPLRADAVVIATGTWLGSLARDFGVSTIVQAGRGYSFTVQPEHMPVAPIYFPAQRVAATPLGDGLRVAGMMEFRKPDAPLDPRRIKAIVDAATPMLTGVDWDARTDEWVGSRPCTADGLPLVGRTKSPRVFVSGGHGMWGIALGPLSGKLLAAQIARGEDAGLLSSFDPLR